MVLKRLTKNQINKLNKIIYFSLYFKEKGIILYYNYIYNIIFFINLYANK